MEIYWHRKIVGGGQGADSFQQQGSLRKPIN